MKKKLTGTLFFFILIMVSCGSNDWNTSKFNITSDVLKDGEKVKLLYISPFTKKNDAIENLMKETLTEYNIDINKTTTSYIDEKGYTQLVAVSQETNDTVNILTTYWYDWENYIGETLEFYKIDDVFEIYVKHDIKKVRRDSKYDYIADNNYPTIIGGVRSIEIMKNK